MIKSRIPQWSDGTPMYQDKHRVETTTLGDNAVSYHQQAVDDFPYWLKEHWIEYSQSMWSKQNWTLHPKALFDAILKIVHANSLTLEIKLAFGCHTDYLVKRKDFELAIFGSQESLLHWLQITYPEKSKGSHE